MTAITVTHQIHCPSGDCAKASGEVQDTASVPSTLLLQGLQGHGTGIYSSLPDSKSQLWAAIQVGLCAGMAHSPLLQLHVHVDCLPHSMQSVCTLWQQGAHHRHTCACLQAEHWPSLHEACN